MKLSKRQQEMIERSVRWMISDLQYQRHQAQTHGCSTGSYDAEIEEYRQLKQYLSNGGIQNGQASD